MKTTSSQCASFQFNRDLRYSLSWGSLSFSRGMMISRFTCSCWRNKCLESSAVERRLSPGDRLHLTVIFSLFTDTNKKGCDWNTRLELKITQNSGCPRQFGTVGKPTCTSVITYECTYISNNV